jgi:predicted AAA+ superfamily ATPase
LIKVITGVRRCGKSTLLKLYEEKLVTQGIDRDSIHHIDFDDKKNEWLLDRNVLFSRVSNLLTPNSKHYFLFDEIQMVSDFNATINSLRLLGNTDIYLTGSNSRLLSSEIGTLPTSRHIDLQLWPLSFSEFFAVDGADFSKEASFGRYLRYGGLLGVYELLLADGTNSIRAKWILLQLEETKGCMSRYVICLRMDPSRNESSKPLSR